MPAPRLFGDEGCSSEGLARLGPRLRAALFCPDRHVASACTVRAASRRRPCGQRRRRSVVQLQTCESAKIFCTTSCSSHFPALPRPPAKAFWLGPAARFSGKASLACFTTQLQPCSFTTAFISLRPACCPTQPGEQAPQRCCFERCMTPNQRQALSTAAGRLCTGVQASSTDPHNPVWSAAKAGPRDARSRRTSRSVVPHPKPKLNGGGRAVVGPGLEDDHHARC